MVHIYNNSGKYTVVVSGIVVGHNLTKEQAMRKVEEYDFD